MKLLITGILTCILATFSQPTKTDPVVDVEIVTMPDGTIDVVPGEIYRSTSKWSDFKNIDWNSANYGSCFTDIGNGDYIFLICDGTTGNCNFNVRYTDGTYAAGYIRACGEQVSVFFDPSDGYLIVNHG